MELAERILRGRRAVQFARQKGMDTSEWERHLAELLTEAGRAPGREEGFEPWALWEWRRVSIPQWREILRESIESTDRRREEYSRWMLREMLLDPEYQEETS